MQKRLSAFFVLLLIISFSGCDARRGPLSAGQQKAVDNSIKFINNSSFTSKERIDTTIVKIENATDNTWKSVWNGDKQIDENSIDTTDWVIYIGDRSDHAFAVIVCDSSTFKVIGYIPIE